MCWERRHEQPPAFPSASEGIAAHGPRGSAAARLRDDVDASDVVTAGAPGDSTHLLRALLAEATAPDLRRCPRSARDREAVAARRGRIGSRSRSRHARSGAPRRRWPVKGPSSEARQHGFGRTVVFAVDHMRIVITEGRRW